jgi:hypothetical protein
MVGLCLVMKLGVHGWKIFNTVKKLIGSVKLNEAKCLQPLMGFLQQ